MALVVLLRGVNVGGHRRFRPAALTQALAHLDAVNIGAAGTFVVRRPIAPAALREEFAGRLPFVTEVVIAEGREFLRLLSRYRLAGLSSDPGFVRFVSVLAGAPRQRPALPIRLPASGQWLVRVVAREGRLAVGVYRRRMQAIGQLGKLDGIFGVPVTTRSWSTLERIARVLAPGAA